MECPHCGKSVHEEWNTSIGELTNEDEFKGFQLAYMVCPSCDNVIVDIMIGNASISAVGGKTYVDSIEDDEDFEEHRIWPRKGFSRKAHGSVPPHIAKDFEEATLVLPFSPKASAALSRRCLQNILVEAGGVTKKDLVDQINEAVEKNGFTPSVRRLLGAIRTVGNFAAHPMKDKNTGEILDVEEGEAELNVSTLESLMDYFYIRPLEEQKKIDEINQKLAAAGKPLIT